jgi:acyl dehydratase
MAIVYETLKSWPFEPREHAYTQKDVILYALGLGVGGDPVSPEELRFVYEDGLQVLPTFAGVLGYPGFWLKDPATGIDWRQVLNGEQGMVLHRPLAPEGLVIGRTRIDEIVDKGPGKGALIYSSRDIVDAASQELIATVTNTIFARGDGGFGGTATVSRSLPPVPAGPADLVLDTPTLKQAALIYRLSGDYNPLHADPEVARSVGYPQPILHGAATWGIAGHALLRLLCQGDPARFRRFEARFSSPVFPGETIRTEAWRTGPGQASFRCRVPERDVVVLTNGILEYAEA